MLIYLITKKIGMNNLRKYFNILLKKVGLQRIMKNKRNL